MSELVLAGWGLQLSLGRKQRQAGPGRARLGVQPAGLLANTSQAWRGLSKNYAGYCNTTLHHLHYSNTHTLPETNSSQQPQPSRHPLNINISWLLLNVSNYTGAVDLQAKAGGRAWLCLSYWDYTQIPPLISLRSHMYVGEVL